MANGHMERYSKSTALRETQGLDTEDQTLDDSCTWGVCNRQSRGDGNSTVAAWGQGGCRSCTGFIPGNDDVLILDHETNTFMEVIHLRALVEKLSG